MKRFLLTVNGRLDQPHLDALRNALGLNRIGSAADPVGTVLGARSDAGQSVPTAKLTLWRSDTDVWSIVIDESSKTIDSEFPVSPEAWRGLAELAVRAAGLTIGDRKEFPGVPPNPDSGQA
ncbi:hypothetical protein [Nocardia sp. NBC_01327]|uniref:hypothetical protein n=1 Tax=Nocardia sp. NBC_01327 TaxID=2903593 RepID=UPI002E15F02F|nr:hypothetical protein OG326_30770 [Nocardia sp. NBC_01327]